MSTPKHFDQTQMTAEIADHLEQQSPPIASEFCEHQEASTSNQINFKILGENLLHQELSIGESFFLWSLYSE